MTLLEMIDKRNQAWNAAKAFVESRRGKDGLLSAEDAKTYTEMEQKVKDYSAEIERLQAMEAMDAEMSKPLNAPLTGKPMGADKPKKTGRASDEYKKGILTALRTNFKQIVNVLQEGVDADGGYLVPEEYDTRLIETLTDENIIRSLATTITTSGDHKINIASTAPAAAWIEEGGALSFGDATFDQILLDAHKLHVAIKVTEELLYDNAFNLEAYIIKKFGEALANAEEDAFLNGDGNGAYLWQPSTQAGEPNILCGYPVRTSQFAPENAIAFGDFSYYNIGDRGTRSFAELRELFAGNGMIGFVAKERVDGKLILPEAVQILKIGA